LGCRQPFSPVLSDFSFKIASPGDTVTDKTERDAVTAFSKSEVTIRKQYGEAPLDPAEFERKLTRCALSCKGMCCYGGVSVNKDTAEVIQQLATERKSDFQQMGLDLPDTVVSPTEWHGVVGNITAVKPRPFRSMVEDYPAHFDETACTFLMDDARCGLQVLSIKDGKHPWYYKPFSCWLLPIKLSNGEIRLFDERTDPFLFSDYPGFISRTHCGRTDDCGSAASEVLTPELEFLGKILNRDLVRELSDSDKSSTATDPRRWLK
jgi:hypothetical protein